MKKNEASQSIGGELITASDGSAFTGSVTVYVTGDAGTQALGSVGSGVCVHEGNGYHTYAPAQAETNYDQIAFTFIGSGAVPATVQVFTSFPQTVDNDTKISLIPTTAMRGTDDAALATELTTAQNDLDTITGSDGATLATAQGLYAPAKAGDNMGTVSSVTGNVDGSTASVTGAVGSVTAIDTTAGAVDVVTLVTTTTTNTDMRGTDSANTTVPDAAGTAPTAVENRQEMDSNSTQLNTTLPALIDDLAIKKNTAFSNFEFLMVLTSDHVTPATGLTVTGQRSINGAAFASVAGTIAEVSNGIYQFDALAADTNGDVITWRFLSATADDAFITFKTVA